MPIRRVDGRKRQKASGRQGLKTKRIDIARIIKLANKKTITPICSVCSKIRISVRDKKGIQKNVWVDVGIKNPRKQDPRLPPLSHGYCGPCARKAFNKIKK